MTNDLHSEKPRSGAAAGCGSAGELQPEASQTNDSPPPPASANLAETEPVAAMEPTLTAARQVQENRIIAKVLESVEKAADRTRRRYAALHNDASGLEQIIYGEICDAFSDFQDRLTSELETLSVVPTVCAVEVDAPSRSGVRLCDSHPASES